MIYNDPTLRKKKAQKVTLTLTGTGDEDECWISINDVKYYTAQTLEVDIGTEVYCYGDANNVSNEFFLNGVNGGRPCTYTAMKNAQIEFSFSRGPFISNSISITESPTRKGGDW